MKNATNTYGATHEPSTLKSRCLRHLIRTTAIRYNYYLIEINLKLYKKIKIALPYNRLNAAMESVEHFALRDGCTDIGATKCSVRCG